MSVSSPVIGVVTDQATTMHPESAAADDAMLEVGLTHARWRHLFWAVVGLGLGLLFLWSFGGVGKTFGVLFALGGVVAARAFARTLAHPPGVIRVHAGGLLLPPGPCTGTHVDVGLGDVRHAYLLRRAVPFLVASPMLVVETALGVFTYPRDWFETDGDQRRLAASINRRLGRS